MEESDESATAALGLNPSLFVNDVLNMVDDVRHGAFEYCLQEAVPQTIGAATATEKADELEQGVNDIHYLVKGVLDKGMSNWEKYCLRHCFTIPEGFAILHKDDSSAKEPPNDVNLDSDLDTELESLRRKLEDANNESEELQRELSSLERQTECKRNLDSPIAELLKVFENKSFQDNFQDLAKAIPLFHQKMKDMKRKKAKIETNVHEDVSNFNGLRDRKRLAPGKCTTVIPPDIDSRLCFIRVPVR
ncbi:hypothetical protein GUJ93_ZPchr0002g25795 [Zizania palustris]|uniref:Uncharacterized protein n=1 Tax=Zizania palustris TaxID=103762 RepID=A0A8J5RIF8_ZIZPA|nr:hypothetical protein GUJ93_ZPchr0002g25795 [Zizania palustris]